MLRGEVWFPDLDLILISLISKNQENLISWSPLFSNQEILILQYLQILISWSRPDPDLIAKYSQYVLVIKKYIHTFQMN